MSENLCDCENVETEVVEGSEVCTKCGMIISQNYLTSDLDPAFISKPIIHNKKLPYYLMTKKKKSDFLNKLQFFCKQVAMDLRCPSSLILECNLWVEKVFQMDKFRNKSTLSKKTITLCILHLLCKSRDWTISINKIFGSSKLEKDSKKLLIKASHWKNELVRTFPELTKNENTPNLSILVERNCKEFELDKHYQEKVMGLLEICRKLWVTEGHLLEPILISICYLVYISRKNNKIKLNEFCQKYKIKYTSTLNKRKTDLIKMLRVVGARIPWVGGSQGSKVKIDHLLVHLDDLIHFHKMSIEEEIKEKEEEEENQNNEENKDAKIYRILFKPKSQIYQTPPHPSSPSRFSNLDNESLDEEDMSDNEINYYLHGDEEIEQRSKI